MHTQQINLLRREARVPASLWWSLLALIFWATGLGGWAWHLNQQNHTMELQLAREKVQGESLRSTLAARRQTPDATNRDRQNLDDLRQLVQPHSAALSALDKGELGGDSGPVFLFRQLSSLADGQVWLTSVSLSLSQSGLSVRVSGLAENQAAVVHYQQQLSQTLLDHHLQLVALDSALDPETDVAATEATPMPVMATENRVRFSLASR